MDGLPEQDQTGDERGGAEGWPRRSRWTCGSGSMSARRSISLRSSTTTASGSSLASVVNDQAALEALLDRAAEHGTAGLVIDQPGSIAQLALAVARGRQVPVAYVPGLVMRRAADLYPGEAKTDKRDAFVIADTGRTRRKQVHWLDVGSDELLERLRVLNGFDIDLAADQTRLTNRCRDALTSVSPGPGTGARAPACTRPASGTCWPSTRP